jgi:hypothetical protein
VPGRAAGGAHLPAGRAALAALTALAVACSRPPIAQDAGPRGDPIEAIAAPVDGGDAGAALLRPWWTGATTLREPPVRLAPGVTGIVAHVPTGYDARGPVHLVLFFHGSDQCALQLASADDVVCKPGEGKLIGGALDARHDDAGTQSIFAVPQFILWGGGSPGRMAERGYFQSFVSELLGETFAPGLGGPRALDDLADVTLIGHSAGQMPVRAILDRGDLADKVRNVVLIDALYDDPETYARWLERGADRKLAAVYGTWGHQAEHGRAIAARVERRAPGSTAVDPPGSFEEAVRGHAVTVKQWPGVEHAWMLLLMMTKVISALDFPRRPIVPTRDPLPDHLRPPAPLVLDAPVRGALADGDTWLENGAAADDYALTLARGDHVVAEVRGGRSETEPCCKLDVFAEILVEGRVVAGDDDSGGFFDSRVEHTAVGGPEDVTVRVTTAGSGRKRGPYSLVVHRL